MLKLRLLSTLLVLAVAAIGCGGGESAQTSPAASPAASSPGATQTAQNSPAASPASSESSVTSNWVSYTSPKGNYTAKFPGQPKEETQTLDTQAGKTDLVLVSYEDRSKKQAYAISHNVFNIPAGATFDVEKGLDGSRDGIARGIGATVEKETKIKSENGFPGREILMTKGEDLTAKARIFYDDGYLYQAFVLVQGKDINKPEVDAFLQSIKFTK